jgi:tetratricopeptide (TPR) repeat protein
MFYAKDYLAQTTDLEARAEMYFFMGQAMEHANDFESAYRFYLLALELKPSNVFYQYFIHNNIGYSLNRLSRYVEAENYLRKAIEIEPERLNGHKNLGLSLEGQGRYTEAARSFVAAVQTNASDPRALRYLEELAERHPETSAEMPDLSYHLIMCRQAVAFAANSNTQNN